MILSSTDELRAYIPNHALSSIDSISGSIYTSEHDFLEEKLGTSLYDAVCAYYKSTTPEQIIASVDDGTEQSPMLRLLLNAQRAVAMDAMARSISIRAVSDNGGGVNVSDSNGYAVADAQTKADYKAACVKEAHSAINIMLRQLELLCKQTQDTTSSTSEQTAHADLTAAKIVELWKESRYYYLCTGVLLPTAADMQQYLNIYDSRERFIQMLPDMQFVEEECIEPAAGRTMTEWLCLLCVYGIPASLDRSSTRLLERIIHRLRKAFCAYLEERTSVLGTTKERRMKAHEEGEKHISAATEMMTLHQADLLTAAAAIDALTTPLPADDIDDNFTDAIKAAPWYVSETATDPTPPAFENNRPENAMFVTPAVD